MISANRVSLWPRALLAVAFLSSAVTSCASGDKKPEPTTTTTATAGGGFATLRDALIDQWLQDQPAWGRLVGLHEFDGKVAAYSSEAIAAQVARLQEAEKDLAAVDGSKLSPDDALDLALLRSTAARRLFQLVDREVHKTDPRFYEELFAVDAYLNAEYAPIDERAQSLLAHEEAALAQLPAIRENLLPVLSKPVAETAAGVFLGYATYLRGDVVRLLSGVGDEAFQARFAKANTALADEAEKLGKELKEKAKVGDASHVLGPDRFKKLLLVQEGLDMSLDEFKKMGVANLQKNKKAYEALKKKVKPKRVSAKELIPLATKMMDESRAFIIDKDIVTIPGEDTAVVKESPPYMRFNPAFLYASGPFDSYRHGFYYITPPDPKWPKKEQRDYLMSRGVLLSTTVHEVYPGHFLQGRWVDRAPTRMQKLADSYSFIEGWAHYAEEMMIDEGFGKEDRENRLGMLTDALLRNCRFVVSLGIHTEGMTLQQAEKAFIKDCHQDKATARQQATRGAYDPGYFAYTLGKLQIMALRDEAKAALGERFSLKAFHDALLAHGAAPVPMLRERVLADLQATPVSAPADEAPASKPSTTAPTQPTAVKTDGAKADDDEGVDAEGDDAEG